MTFSIVARSDDGESWGVAVASKFLAVGSVVPAAVAQVGALATHAHANVAYNGNALSHLDEGATASVALQRLLEEDEGRDHRQVGIVDVDGGAASHTGSACIDWAGGLTGDGFAIQGNCLAGPEVVEAMRVSWESGTDTPFARRLLDALAAGDDAGGDKRGRQSAAILVVRDEAGYDGGDDIDVDLRVDDHVAPVGELARLLELNDLYLVASTPDEKVEVDAALREELETFAQSQGQPDFHTWVGCENYEMRVDDGLAWIDRRILAIVRALAGGDGAAGACSRSTPRAAASPRPSSTTTAPWPRPATTSSPPTAPGPGASSTRPTSCGARPSPPSRPCSTGSTGSTGSTPRPCAASA
jgi:uncharacterized Ntn-hydrolase superfamily protein